jgi:DnaK suppressor protein
MNKSKSAPNPATKRAAIDALGGSTTELTASKATSPTGKTKPRTPPEAIVASKLDSRSAQTVTLSSENQASDALADNIEKTSVLKVREVATKTTKSTLSSSSGDEILSEKQLMEMSDKDYMNAAQLAFFKARL